MGTIHPERTVLAIARTQTSTTRLLEAAQHFRADFRVNVLFTVDATSPFSAGANEILRRAGVRRIVPWAAVPDLHHHLAISASENIDFTASKATTVVLPHGIGFNKYIPVPDTDSVRLAGLPPAEALSSGRVRLVLAHPDQEHQLRAVAPEVAGHTVITGDPTFDHLTAGQPWADSYRHTLGTQGRRLILLSSTWRSEAQLGRRPQLPEQLLRTLPADDYQVAMALHPNIWDWYGEQQIHMWLANALDAGLVLINPSQGWQAALLAADQVIGDHGSLTLYAAALGKPVLLGAFGDEVVAGTPVDQLGRLANHLDDSDDLRKQVDGCFEQHKPHRFEELRSGTFAYVGNATRRLRDALYHQLDLAPPDDDPVITRPSPPLTEQRIVTSFDTYTEVHGPTVTVRRHPRAARGQLPTSDSHRHLAVEETEPNLRLPQNASVIVRRATTANPIEWVRETLIHYPGSRLVAAAVPSGCVVGIRDGRWVTATTSTEDVDPMLLASAVYACLLNGELSRRTILLHAGKRELAVNLQSHP